MTPSSEEESVSVTEERKQDSSGDGPYKRGQEGR